VQFVLVHVDEEGGVVVGVVLAQLCRRTRDLVVSVQDNVIAFVDGDVERGRAAKGGADDVQVVAALVLRPVGEEGAVYVALVVVDGAAAAVAACQIDVAAPQVGHVGLGPGVLVATDDDAGVVAPEKEEGLIKKITTLLFAPFEQHLQGDRDIVIHFFSNTVWIHFKFKLVVEGPHLVFKVVVLVQPVL
jgi:hypothetical protein